MKTVRQVDSILVMDDEESYIAYARYVLEPLGFSVTGAANAAEALEKCASRDFGLIILDGFPQGLEVTRLIRSARPEQRIVLFSCLTEELLPEASALGVACLSKPVLPERLARIARGRDL